MCDKEDYSRMLIASGKNEKHEDGRSRYLICKLILLLTFNVVVQRREHMQSIARSSELLMACSYGLYSVL